MKDVHCRGAASIGALPLHVQGESLDAAQWAQRETPYVSPIATLAAGGPRYPKNTGSSVKDDISRTIFLV
jgi:hypothetical protein